MWVGRGADDHIRKLYIGVTEIANLEIWHDCNEGMVDLDANPIGVKIHYKLLPGINHELDVLIWPHCAKIYCETHYGWVRTWQFLERRWLAFSINHLCPTTVSDLIKQDITVSVAYTNAAFGNAAKNDKSTEVYLPALVFPVKRYFAPVNDLETNESVGQYIMRLLWEEVVKFIPASFVDVMFDKPQPVTDRRHQNAVLYYVKDQILNKPPCMMEESSLDVKKKSEGKCFQFSLSGRAILAGVGRIVLLEADEATAQDTAPVIVLMSTSNLPTAHDEPVFFVNIDNVCDVPVKQLKMANITDIFTSWRLGDDVHCSQIIPLDVLDNIALNDHYAMPVPTETGLKLLGKFIDESFTIELRGLRKTEQKIIPKLFGSDKNDNIFHSMEPVIEDKEEPDVLIAVCRIEAQKLALGKNVFIKGEFPLYPPRVNVEPLKRLIFCTNDVNGVRKRLQPNLHVPPHIILEAQTTLDGSIGFVGATPYDSEERYSRFFCISRNERSTANLVKTVLSINKNLASQGRRDAMLTGFSCEIDQVAFIYVEGLKDGHILLVWDATEKIYTSIKTFFSTTARYFTRLYPELLKSSEPFLSLNTHTPLHAMLACPRFYARPAIPVPSRIATLKLARIMYSQLFDPPCRSDMLSMDELRSFRLELTVQKFVSSDKDLGTLPDLAAKNNAMLVLDWDH